MALRPIFKTKHLHFIDLNNKSEKQFLYLIIVLIPKWSKLEWSGFLPFWIFPQCVYLHSMISRFSVKRSKYKTGRNCRNERPPIILVFTHLTPILIFSFNLQFNVKSRTFKISKWICIQLLPKNTLSPIR